MDAENTISSEAIITEQIPPRKKSGFANPMLWAQLVVFLLGSGLLGFLIYRIGFQTLTSTISHVGWGILLIIALNGARHFLRALCIYLAIAPEQRTFDFRHALAARLGGEAVSVVTFTGPILGEATKAALLRRKIPIAHGGAAVLVDNILYYLSVILMILIGIGLMSFAFQTDHAVRYVLFGLTFFAAFVIVGLFLLAWFRIKPFTWLIEQLDRRRLAPKFILRKKDGILALENNVYHFYITRRVTFFAVFGLSCLAHALSVVEVYSALRLLDFPASLTVGFIIESLTKIVNLVFSFVPGMVGVYEGGNGVILNSLGYTTAAGVALALVRRGAILTWTLIGLGILLWRAVSHGTQKITKNKK